MYQTNCLFFTVEHSTVKRTVFSDFYKLAIAIIGQLFHNTSLEACDFTGKKCEHFGTSVTSGKKNFFCTIIFKMTSTSYNAGDVLQLLEEDDSEFPDSVSSGKEGDEV